MLGRANRKSFLHDRRAFWTEFERWQFDRRAGNRFTDEFWLSNIGATEATQACLRKQFFIAAWAEHGHLQSAQQAGEQAV